MVQNARALAQFVEAARRTRRWEFARKAKNGLFWPFRRAE
jgi:hypothetical protein